jgi:cysteine desulfurase
VVAAADVAAALRDDTAVVAVQHANHEVGSLQPVSAVSEVCAARGVPLFVDACASVGWVPVSVGGASLLAASAHKWGGPAGVGVLVVRKGTRFRSLRREGFAPVPAIVAAVAALEAVLGAWEAEAARLSTLVELVRARAALIPDTEVLGEPRERLPHVVTFSCLYVDGEALVTELDRRGFAVNSGSSCASETGHPSHVLEAMGVLTHGNVRVSLGPSTTEAEVVAFCDAVREVVEDVRRQL